MSINFPSDTRNTINNIRNAIGRNIQFVSEVRSGCPNCSINPYTGESTNSFCVVCSGIGYVVTTNNTNILAHVTWNPSETLKWNTGGQYNEYDCRVQVELTDANLTIIDNSTYVTVDSKRLRIDNKILRGVPQLNRIIINLKEI